ncbi:hypothetical protein [uncultured Pedobacter sp.]
MLRLCLDSATVAGLTTAGTVYPYRATCFRS